MTIIKEYKNGNYKVELYNDGSKVRRYGDKVKPKPEFPESIDLKITDYCEQGCSFCHESSTKRGEHADFSFLSKIISQLPAGVEIALGGGNPMDYPDLDRLLYLIKNECQIANLTVRETHAAKFSSRIRGYQYQKLIYGLGISVSSLGTMDMMSQICQMPLDENVVYHVIMGLNSAQEVLKACSTEKKILVLGYKQFGFGVKQYNTKVQKNIEEWKYWIGTISRRARHVSFDNLAIEQLELQKRLSTDYWSKFYMGGDGQFTMYIDAVKQQFAVSSTSRRYSCVRHTIGSMFEKVRKTSKEEGRY